MATPISWHDVLISLLVYDLQLFAIERERVYNVYIYIYLFIYIERYYIIYVLYTLSLYIYTHYIC